MAGIAVRKIGVGLLTILKWLLQALFAVWKLVLVLAKLFLLLLALVVRLVLAMAGVSAGRR